MTFTLLLISGIAIALTAAFAVVTRTYGYVAEPILVGEATAVGLADPATETLTGHTVAAEVSTECDWQLTTLSALCDAEDLLDALEVQGVEERELVVLGNSCFAVRWR